MSETDWELFPSGLTEDEALAAAVLEVHEGILQGPLAGDPGLNSALGISHRALRHVEDWRVLLLLTPWMLSRLLFPDRPPDLAVPSDWRAERRRDADYRVLGPAAEFRLLGQPQRAHINYHPDLGHYLLQPICLDMHPYRDAEAVYGEWARVIRIRDENLAKAQRDCPLQQEISRRELFTRFRS